MMSYLLALLLFTTAPSLADPQEHVLVSNSDNGRKTCTVLPLGDEANDVPNIREAFDVCGKDGTVVFPDGEEYWIAEKLHATLENSYVEWRGQWKFSPDMDHWRNNSYFIEFQNHRAAFVISGENFLVDGYGTGGIHGNGDVWYDHDEGPPSSEGRPMPFVLWNTSDSAVNNFYIKQSQFWSFNIMNGTNLSFENITCDSLSVNAPDDENWNQNVDGFNTMDARNITLNNFNYHGGDDCIAIKPQSFDIKINNVTCEGGNGIAIGSLGQYLEDNSVENITIANGKLTRHAWDMHSIYIKTWMGHLVNQGDEGDAYESGGEPRGGGWGKVRNIVVENLELHGVQDGPLIHQDSGVQDSGYEGTSKIEVSHLYFRNFTGALKDDGPIANLRCSEEWPCHHIYLEDMEDLEGSDGTCMWAHEETVFGVRGCGEGGDE